MNIMFGNPSCQRATIGPLPDFKMWRAMKSGQYVFYMAPEAIYELWPRPPLGEAINVESINCRPISETFMAFHDRMLNNMRDLMMLAPKPDLTWIP